MSGHSRTPVERLTESEAESVRVIVSREGLTAAARSLGVNAVTLAKAALGADVHRMTVATIRAQLAA